MSYFLKSAVLILTLLVISPMVVESADFPFYWKFINAETKAQESETQQKSAGEKSGEIVATIFSLAIVFALAFFLFIVLTGRHRRGPTMPGGDPTVIGVWDGGGDFGSGGGGCGGCGGGGCGGGCGGCGGGGCGGD